MLVVQIVNVTVIKLKNLKITFFFFLILNFGFSQSKLDSFLKPSDSLNKGRRMGLIISETALATASLIGLNQFWNGNYPKSNFRIVNNNAEWLQIDKAAHVFSSYQIGRAGAELLNWSGMSKKSQLIYGGTLGFAFLSTADFFDGYYASSGFSWGDIAANAGGTALYVSQEILWKEQRIVPKFSFHASPYATLNPSLLGSSYQNQIFKDYNGQTYWLSANVYSFFKQSKIPKWLNVAFGYGVEGLITPNDELVNTTFFPEKQRTRQFYFSFDVDLTKIPTKNHTLKTVFSIFNTLKIPAPTFEINGRGETKFRIFYF